MGTHGTGRLSQLRTTVVMVAVILFAGFAALAPQSAHQASASGGSGSMAMYGGQAQYSVSFGSYGRVTVAGTVYDTAPDSSCARVEVLASTTSGNGSWTWAGRTCGNGTAANFSYSATFYGLKGEWVRLCVGYSCTSPVYWAK